MNRGVPPTARKARTGEFTPPGITLPARGEQGGARVHGGFAGGAGMVIGR